jgi:hypothetical protein
MSTTPKTRWMAAITDEPGPEATDVLSDRESHDFLRLRYGTLPRWRMEGRGPAWSRLGRRVVYLRSDLLAFLAANRVEPVGQS